MTSGPVTGLDTRTQISISELDAGLQEYEMYHHGRVLSHEELVARREAHLRATRAKAAAVA
jgi:hypothetical protein